MSEDGLTIWRSGKRTGTVIQPAAPAIVLIDPKYPHNVGQAVRLASCFGIEQVWFSGSRVSMNHPGTKQWSSRERIPREERMRGYENVTLVNDKNPLERLLQACPGATPVAVELRPCSESLVDFVHPDLPIYVFGPEDGSLPGSILKQCHRFVVIPSYQCLNLATAAGCVLYDRAAKMPLESRPYPLRGPLSASST